MSGFPEIAIEASKWAAANEGNLFNVGVNDLLSNLSD